MNYWQAIIVGLVQGTTEILPISSTAHLVLLPKWLGFESLGLEFDVMMNFGSWIAIMLFFGKTWKDMLKSLVLAIRNKENIVRPKDPNLRLLNWLLIATIPAFVIGAVFGDWIEQYLRSSTAIAIALIVGGIVLWVVDKYGKADKSLENLTVRGAVGVGLVQALAMIPGVSRSGACIIGGRVVGFDKKDSATLAFLLGAPVILGATLSVIPEIWKLQILSGEVIVAFVSATLGTYLTIGIFYEFIKKQSLMPFVVYRIVLGMVILWVTGI